MRSLLSLDHFFRKMTDFSSAPGYSTGECELVVMTVWGLD